MFHLINLSLDQVKAIVMEAARYNTVIGDKNVLFFLIKKGSIIVFPRMLIELTSMVNLLMDTMMKLSLLLLDQR